MRTLRKIMSRAKPAMARLRSPVFPHYYLLREDGGFVLREDGSKIKRERG